jgi:hypothetical protein
MVQKQAKIFWALLLILSAAVSCLFLFKSVMGSWQYLRLNRYCPAAIETWEIKEISASKFALIASYRFHAQGKEHEGKTEFRSFYLLNRFAAETAIEKLKKERWGVWHSLKNPHYSSLEKKLPYKSLIYFAMSLGIFLYFLYIFQYRIKENSIEA